MTLPSDFSSLTIAQQLLVLANLERVDRGLLPISGLAGGLNNNAQQAAASDEDPTPDPFYGDSYSANWEGGYASPLEADFVWMYDDGLGSGNLDCKSPNFSGCWGHRQDVLLPFDPPLVLGAAAVGGSLTELFVGGDTQTGSGGPDAPVAPLWTSITQFLPVGVQPRAVTIPSAARLARIIVSASGEDMDVHASTGSSSPAWSVSPTECQLTAGSSCNMTVQTNTATGPSTATLTLSGPNGSQSVPLVHVAQAALGLSVSRSHIVYGTHIIVAAALRSVGGAIIPGELVTLSAPMARSRGTTAVARGTTDVSGVAEFRVVPSQSTVYKAGFGGSAAFSAAMSATRAVTVSSRVTARLEQMYIGGHQLDRIVGTVSPHEWGQSVALQVERGGSWRTIAEMPLNRRSKFNFGIPNRRGLSRYRVLRFADRQCAKGVSAPLSLAGG